jgi:1-acyl-sn-glycerol-3-phosphate acyltransferase
MPRTPDGSRRAGDRETEHKDTVGAEASPVRTWLRLLFWLAVVAVVALSLLPSQRLPGFTATVWDKAQHAGGFALLALLGLRAYASPRKGTWPVLAGLMALGIAIELAQSATGWRHGDARDAMADAVGLALGWLLVRVWPNAPAGNTVDVMHHAHPNQFTLLTQRRFAPFFWVQFLGAGNDNLFKFAFTVMVTFQLQVSWLPAEQAGLVIGALFILPFVLFSATSGQLADKLEKSQLIRLVKSLEMAIMALAVWGFLMPDVPTLLLCVFLMGLHSTLFGPVKFAYLPQHLQERELTGGNGMIEMGTFVAILLGNVVGGLLIAIPQDGAWYAALACLGVAVLGRALAQAVPVSPATDPGLKINWNPFTETWRNLKLAHENIVVFRSLLGISWMWFFGAVFLSQFPVYARNVLHGNEQVASLLLVVFSVGVGTGALMCELLSRRHVEIGLVPLGAIGMTVFAVDLYVASSGLPPVELQTVSAFLERPAHWRVMADLALLSLFAGIYSVPMYALIQVRSLPTHRARIIAANNILNALFMIVSALGVGVLLGAGFTIPEVFLVVGLLNAAVAAYIFLLVPEYLLRFIAFVMTRAVYRFRVRGEEHIPTTGAAILACNHVSYVDAVLLMAASPRPIRFIMDHRIFSVPVLGWLFRLAKAIPIAPQQENPQVYAAAFEQARQVLEDGDLLGIFPEGNITRDGALAEFKGGIMKVLEMQPVPVVPMALQNLWGSTFSRVENGKAMARPLRRGLFSRVGLAVGPAIAATDMSLAGLQARVRQLLQS